MLFLEMNEQDTKRFNSVGLSCSLNDGRDSCSNLASLLSSSTDRSQLGEVLRFFKMMIHTVC